MQIRYSIQLEREFAAPMRWDHVAALTEATTVILALYHVANARSMTLTEFSAPQSFFAILDGWPDIHVRDVVQTILPHCTAAK